MDINLARTFLEIVDTRNFGRAAERLNVTQTAVSARIRTLEELLGCALFVRNKAGASLTPAGQRFMRHARTLVQVWESARHQAAVPSGRRAIVYIGCETSLWDPLLLDWLLLMRRTAPHLALRTEVGVRSELLSKASEGLIDIAVVYAPEQRPGLKVVLLIEEKLVMVSTERGRQAPLAPDYVFVDWGPEFTAQHELAFPELSNAATFAGLGPLGREYLLHAGGSGYFRLNVVRRHLDSGRLHLVPGAPQFLYPAYAVYSENADPKTIAPALAGLQQVVRPPGLSNVKANRRSTGRDKPRGKRA
jgi:LysR family transcriptional regulator, flagellar master operon regulator